MPTTPFEAIALDHLSGVTGGCKKKQPPPLPPAAAAQGPAPGGFEAETNISISGYGGQAAPQIG